MSNKRRVVVTGMGVVSPLGNSIDDFARNLFAGKSGIVELTRLHDFGWFDASDFPIRAAGQVEQPDMNWMGRDKKRIGRFTQYALAAFNQTMDDKLFFFGDDPYRAGVILGAGGGGMEEGEEAHERIKKGRRPDLFTVCKRMPNGCSGKLAQVFSWNVDGTEFKMRGDNYVVSSACATSAHAIGEAYRKIKDGYLDVAVTGGTEAPITPVVMSAFAVLGALSKNPDYAKASRPFDAERDGFVMGEGAGILVLEEKGHALTRGAKILCEIVGYGSTDDAYHDTDPHPDAEGARNAMRIAIEEAGISPSQIGYINAHGTSTEPNDRVETLAVRKVFGALAQAIPVSSTKSMTGHLLGAAGAVEAIATLLALQRGVVPPTINYENKDPNCDLDYVPNESREVKGLEYAISNSFGFTGHNACLVFRKY